MVCNAAFEHFCSSFSYLGIEIRAVRILYFKQPTHMIYSRDALADRLAVFDIKLIEKSSRTGLHGMAESDRLHAGIPAEPGCKLSHGIGIVEEICVRADFFHIVGEILEDGNSAQGSKNSADAVRIRDSLAKSVFFRHFEIDYRARIVETDLNGVYNKISPAKCIFALLNAEIFADRRAVLVYIPIERRDHEIRLFESLGVDVIQRDIALAQSGSEHNIAKDILCKHGASGTHKSYFHKGPLFCYFFIRFYYNCCFSRCLHIFKLRRKFARSAAELLFS